MIHVIASIHIRDGRVAEFLEIFKANIPQVLQEKGCVEYLPTMDFPTGLPPQELNGQVVTIIEKWQSLDDLRAHLSSPHMLAYRTNVQGIVEKVELKVLQRA